MTKCWLFPQCNRLRHTNIQGRCKCLYVRSTYQSVTSTLLLRHFVSSFQGVQFLFFPFFPYFCFASEAKICNKIENGVIVVCVFVRFTIKQVVCWLWCSSILCFHLTSQPFPNMGIRHICVPRSVKFMIIVCHLYRLLLILKNFALLLWMWRKKKVRKTSGEDFSGPPLAQYATSMLCLGNLYKYYTRAVTTGYVLAR